MRSRLDFALLLGILLAAIALRAYRLGDELWLDEILTQIRVSQLGLAELMRTYESQNQHALYSLLARLSIDVLGDTPLALRLPAAAFGVLSIAALYLLGRDLLTSREALLAAALLAVSDVHVWFSQNARGYSALLFFTLLSSWLLLRALARDRRSLWLAYALVVALALYVHLTMLFVVVAHVLLVLRRRALARGAGSYGDGVAPTLATPLAGPALGFGGAAALAALLYAPIIPQILAVTAVEGRGTGIPEWSSSRWAMSEVVRTLREAFPHPVLALLAVVLGVAGAWSLRRRQPVLLELLIVPVVIGIVVVVGSGHHVWPRLFFFAMGFAALVVVAGATALGAAVERRFPAVSGFVRRVPHTARSEGVVAGTVLAALLIAASASALPSAYGPKQRHAEAIALIEADLRPGDAVVAVGPATTVLQSYYGKDWPRLQDGAELAEVRSRATRTWLVHSFPILLRARRADVVRMLDEDFTLIARLPGTLHGGDVLVWRADRPAEGFSPPAP